MYRDEEWLAQLMRREISDPRYTVKACRRCRPFKEMNQCAERLFERKPLIYIVIDDLKWVIFDFGINISIFQSFNDVFWLHLFKRIITLGIRRSSS